ncbi:unnamed protein product [Vicia faba]|uniref:CCR4-Not complex component Not N-terminal domain-containing protein n=1 Tax=Vicia faba TaxID=3906 RepID=A0AAV1AX29_VICFA|nr:unnamed protein product [Vicia faba]
MGASRKLQGEIDRVLKKVQEGVEVFDSIWNKVYDTDNANQKEKFEADLKKEIKKLQRYRDQIKTWIQSSEIKDKKVSAAYEQALVDARKLIEREMERFKICEKETKTKAFSKEGLGQQPKTDPREKAKSETRDWLNNVVGELESQIDNFEAELEGLTVKKGKNRPPRLTHLETSITRHKAHIKKCELVLRLLDNDELSPEQVNDVKDFLDDYVERNQEDFDEFDDVDELYISLPLDKVDTLEDLVTIPTSVAVAKTISSLPLDEGKILEDLVTIPTGLAKVAPGLSLKSPLAVSASQSASSQTSEQADETASQDSNSDIVAKTPPPKSGGISSSASTPTGNNAAPAFVNVSGHNLSSSPAAAVFSVSSSVRNVLENANVNQSASTKEEDINSFPSRRPSPSLSDAALVRGRNSLSNQATASIPLGSGNMVSGNGAFGSLPSASEITKRNILAADDRLGSSGMVQPLVSPLSNRLILPQVGKTNDGTASVDSSTVNEAAAVSGRVFSPSVVPGMQWRPGSPFPNQNDAGQLRGRTEIAPDQREKFLQKFQQVQQGPSTLLNMPSLVAGNHKQFSSQQQSPLLQQFNSQGSSVSSQSSMGLGAQSPSLGGISSVSLQQPNSLHSPSSQQAIPGAAKDAGSSQLSTPTLFCSELLIPDSGATDPREWEKLE